MDTIIRHNLIRRVRGAGVSLGPLYQGVRITGNTIVETQGSPLVFFRSHGPALVDNNVISGPGAESGEGVKLRGAEATVFARNLFADCAFTSEPLPASVAGGTISYRPHSLVTKQTIPALALDNRWLGNLFVRGGLDRLPKDPNTEADYNGYLAGAKPCPWGDTHGGSVAGDGGFALRSKPAGLLLSFDPAACPKVQVPTIDAELIGRFALTQTIEDPDGRPITLAADFFGHPLPPETAGAGPFVEIKDAAGVSLFDLQAHPHAEP